MWNWELRFSFQPWLLPGMYPGQGGHGISFLHMESWGKKPQSHYKRKSSSSRWPSSFDNTWRMNMASSTQINPTVLMEDFMPESTPHRLSLFSWLLWENMIWPSLRPATNQMALHISFKIPKQRRWLLQRLETAHLENPQQAVLRTSYFQVLLLKSVSQCCSYDVPSLSLRARGGVSYFDGHHASGAFSSINEPQNFFLGEEINSNCYFSHPAQRNRTPCSSIISSSFVGNWPLAPEFWIT